MKVGDKYVIEIEEIIRGYGNAEDDHVHEPIARIKGFNTLVFDQYGLEKLEPYEDNWENVYRKGYVDGKNAVINESEKITSKDISDAYEEGLNDAWKLVKRIESVPEDGGLTNEQIAEVFGQYWSSFELYNSFSAEEALGLYKRWEEQQKQDAEDAEIKVGDEVIDYLGYKGVITKSRKGDSEFVQWMRYDGHTYGSPESSLVKTGRHFDAIAEVLAELRGE